MEQIQKTDAEVIQEEASQPEVSVDASIGSTEMSVEAAGLQEALSTVADGFSVRGFKCGKCGLAHMHDTDKHRASDSFDMSVDEAASMEYANFCHCGVNELARHGNDYGVDEGSASRTAGNAPIPDKTERELNEKFGTPA